MLSRRISPLRCLRSRATHRNQVHATGRQERHSQPSATVRAYMAVRLCLALVPVAIRPQAELVGLAGRQMAV